MQLKTPRLVSLKIQRKIKRSKNILQNHEATFQMSLIKKKRNKDVMVMTQIIHIKKFTLNHFDAW